MERAETTELPEAVDLTYYAEAVRTGLLPYRIANIFVSAALFLLIAAVVLAGLGLLLTPAAAGTGAAGPGLIETAASPILTGALLLVIPFALYRHRLARILGVVFAAQILFLLAFVGTVKLIAAGLFALGGETEEGVIAIVFAQGLTYAVFALLFAAIPLGLLRTLRMERGAFDLAWRLGRTPVQIFAFPGWFRRLGAGRLIAYPAFFVLNGLFCIALAHFYVQILASAFVLEAGYAEALRDPDAGDPAALIGERTGVLLVFLLLVLMAGGLLRIGRWVAVHFVPVEGRGERGPPILFLRGFADDQVFLGKLKLAGLARLLTMESYPPNLDAMLAHEAGGPVLAIGNPGDRMAKVGAPRLMAGDTDWQALVMEKMQAAPRILIVVEASPGTVWEIGQILADPALLAKTVFLKSPKSRAEETALPETAEEHAALARVFALPPVMAVEMGPAGIARLYAARYPDALEYQCLLRAVFDPVLRPPREGARASISV